MGERKVLNKYISPDFDPSIIPKMKRDRTKLVEVRMMLPFSLRCCTCGEYMYKGKKFNSKKEDVQGDDYMGIRKYRFIVKCTVCSAEIAFKTDPKNSDYECEWGATRNFEMWRDNDTALADANSAREEEEKMDAMKSLENRTLDSKIEMDVLDALDEIKAINQRHERVDTDLLLKHAAERASNIDVLTQSDEMLLKNAKFRSKLNESEDLVDKEDFGVGAIVQKQLHQFVVDSASVIPNVAPLEVNFVKKKRKLDAAQSINGTTSKKIGTVSTETPTQKSSCELQDQPVTGGGDKNGLHSTSTMYTSNPTTDSVKNSLPDLSGLAGLASYGGSSSEEET